MICDNIPGLVSRQRQLCQRYPDIMRSVGEGAREWIRECQHQFRHHRWNCTTLDRDHTVFGRVMLRSRGSFYPSLALSLSMLGYEARRLGTIPCLLYFIIRQIIVSKAQDIVQNRPSVPQICRQGSLKPVLWGECKAFPSTSIIFPHFLCLSHLLTKGLPCTVKLRTRNSFSSSHHHYHHSNIPNTTVMGTRDKQKGDT